MRGEDAYRGPWTASTPNPILVINSTFDPNTSYANAVHVAQLLGNAVLLTQEGYGHLSFQNPSACVDQAMTDYLTELITPPRGHGLPVRSAAVRSGFPLEHSSGDWGGYWGKQGPEFLERRLALYDAEQRMVLGANTFRQFVEVLGPSTEESEVSDPVNTRMRNMPTTVVSTTLEGPLDWPNATLVSGDAVDVVARLKEESEVPLRSHGSLSMNRALMAAGLVDRVQVTLFPVITGQTGDGPALPGCGRLRPRADREPDARRQHPRAHLPAHPARLRPSMVARSSREASAAASSDAPVNG